MIHLFFGLMVHKGEVLRRDGRTGSRVGAAAHLSLTSPKVYSKDVVSLRGDPFLMHLTLLSLYNIFIFILKMIYYYYYCYYLILNFCKV